MTEEEESLMGQDSLNDVLDSGSREALQSVSDISCTRIRRPNNAEIFQARPPPPSENPVFTRCEYFCDRNKHDNDLETNHPLKSIKSQRKKPDRGRKRTWADYLKLVTVEPIMFLYMMAFMLTSVVEQAFFIHKACTVDLGYPLDVCLNLTEHNETNKKVQVVVTTFHQYNDIASHVVPIFLALFVGAWSDRRGRKLLLLLGLMGKLWYSIWIVINSLQDQWRLNEIIWTASFPSGITGADLSIFTAAFAYLSDITTPESRSQRITILDVTYLASMPLGVALGKYLFACFHQSYSVMFTINAFLLLIALLYGFVRLDWVTTPQQQQPLKLCCWPLSAKDPDSRRLEGASENQPNCLLDFFDKKHLIDSVKTIVKRRPDHGRCCLIFLILSMGFYTFQRGTLLCIPLMGKLLNFSDTLMLLIGTSSHALARVVFALAEKSWLFFVGASIASFGPVVAPVLRSMASKIVPADERGRVFAVLSVADTAVPLFSGVVYTQVYNASIHTYPSAIYWVTVATQMFVFVVAVVFRFTRKNLPVETSSEGS